MVVVPRLLGFQMVPEFLFTRNSVGLLRGRPEVLGVPQQSVPMNLAVDGAPADVQARRGRADIPLTGLEHATQRVAFRAAQRTLPVRIDELLAVGARRFLHRAAGEPLLVEVLQREPL